MVLICNPSIPRALWEVERDELLGYSNTKSASLECVVEQHR